MSWHDCRHTYASTLIAAGLPVPDIARWMGHGDGGSMLLTTYAHALPNAPERARAALDAAFNTEPAPVIPLPARSA